MKEKYRFAYYPGCSLHSTSREYGISTKLICKDLGINLTEIPEWVCCGATPAHTTSELTAMVLPAKSMLWARKEKLSIAVPCAACYSRLKLANIHIKKDKDLKRNVSEVLGEEYDGEVEVLHLARVIVEKYGLDNLKQRIKKGLKDLKIASYYGCLLTRPPEVCDYDRIENPVFLDKLAETLGAIPIRWNYKTECCGATSSLTKKEISVKLVGNILKDAKKMGAECIMVACPLCQFNLDGRQPEVMSLEDIELNLPVLYFTQVVGLALGYSYKDLMFKKHIIDPKELLYLKEIL